MKTEEIKFRAYHKPTHKMLNIGNPFDAFYTIDDDGVHFGEGDVVVDNMNEFIFMQSINMKDKNGKEIYEGDICFDGINKFEIKHEIRKSTRGGHGDCAYTISSGFHLSGYGNEEECDKIEIIGNVYENAELLIK